MYAARIITASILAASIVGCVSVGKKIDRSAVEQIRVGETTKDDLIATFGTPTNQYYDENGTLAMTWMHTQGSLIPGDMHLQSLIVKFDDDNMVQKFNLAGGAQ